LHVGAIEAHATGGERVEVRRLHHRVAIGAEVIAEIVATMKRTLDRFEVGAAKAGRPKKIPMTSTDRGFAHAPKVSTLSIGLWP
jgi:hypothetical protein